jgi:heat-inducible transcriptional repressor
MRVVVILLDERKRQVLMAIVHDYIQTAEPVGSRTIARRYELGVSPATIRNEMADLEEMGYLAQPHTSAGRIPSDKGYRLYVDSLIAVPSLTSAEVALIKKHLGKKLRGQEFVLETAARLLSTITNYTSIVLSPSTATATLHALQVVPLDVGRAVIMIITNQGVVASDVVEIPSLSAEDFQVICNMINATCAGLSLSRLKKVDLAALRGRISEEITAFEDAMDLIITSLERREADRLVLGGAANILNQPEFRDMHKLRNVLKVLEEEELVFKLVTAAAASPTSVNIGAENPLDEVKECSIITATYTLVGHGTGQISILGPTRMEYPRVMALLRFVSQVISEKTS